MKTDRELLELAAKAAGYTVLGVECIDEYSEARYAGSIVLECKDEHDWPFSFAPLTDDGDALRLAVNLGLIVRCYEESIIVDGGGISTEEYDLSCRHAATRRAIVRAAAAIGESMP